MNSRIDGWHHKMLLPAGKIILIWQILSSILTYMLEASNPPKRVLEQMEGRFSSFFCGQHEKRESTGGLPGTSCPRPRRKGFRDPKTGRGGNSFFHQAVVETKIACLVLEPIYVG
ncbi:uncharacterized protein M6B38_304295 [Iris pallida]|uniref:Uncharacterized protein n=1 Tax=Iris pallida TaxID=29817 RepID=A0AAX6HN37_IRIPA|nr:uncharacterized protein M6B38_304295 [Iris pallida]